MLFTLVFKNVFRADWFVPLQIVVSLYVLSFAFSPTALICSLCLPRLVCVCACTSVFCNIILNYKAQTTWKQPRWCEWKTMSICSRFSSPRNHDPDTNDDPHTPGSKLFHVWATHPWLCSYCCAFHFCSIRAKSSHETQPSQHSEPDRDGTRRKHLSDTEHGRTGSPYR